MVYLNQLGMISPLGNNTEEAKRRLLEFGQSGIIMTGEYSKERRLPLGCVDPGFLLPCLDGYPLHQQSRNNQLALAALQQIRREIDQAMARFCAERVGVVIGTSTSGIAEGEAALAAYQRTDKLPPRFHYGQQELASPAGFLAAVLGARGPAYVHSSACASSAKALASAARLLLMNLCDVVIAGGVDSLCDFTIAGFTALESVSTRRCNPLSRNRDGINIGEGAALFLVSREPAVVSLRGWGESSDGYHVSSPDPTGVGARRAMEQALSRAGVTATEIDYINLHGTATVQNDAMEARVVHALFGDRVAASSTKPMTGHALGAAGAVEAGLCWLAMQDDNPAGRLPPHLWDGEHDPALPVLQLTEPGSTIGRHLRWSVSNSFAFGGANATLVMRRE
jgi:3-oxoacyl-[acyl-carrier-protein] synthase I